MKIRNIMLAVATTLILAGSTISLGGTQGLAPAPPRPIPPHGTGISTKLSVFNPAELEKQLDGMQAAGATWVRTDLSWNDVQGAGPDTYNWEIYDRVVDAVHRRKMQTLFIIGLTPAWARPESCTNSELCPPASSTAYANFAGAAAERYVTRGVHSWEVWNEPNISHRYRGGTNPTEYVKMLKSTYTTIKEIDPTADIIAAGTAPSATNAENLSPTDFLQAMYDLGAQGYFTAISTHPYTYPLTPSTSSPHDAWGQITRMREIMTAYGDGDKQIWLTEFGAPTNGPNLPGEYVSEDIQAQIMMEAAEYLDRQTWAGPLFWYEYQDPSDNAATSENFYGLLRANGTPKPALEEFKKAAKIL